MRHTSGYLIVQKSQFLLMVLSFALIGSCEKESSPPQPIPEYSFFVAGHSYGHPGTNNAGLHPPFVSNFDLIKNDSLMDFGFLTGDIVSFSTNFDWNEVDAQLEDLQMPVYFAAGNHDLTNRALYENRYGSTYYSFVHENDLFITLDPNYDQWNITNDQLIFLDSVLALHAESVNNIFVFFHQVLWWSPENEYASVTVNSVNDKADTINFWSEVEPRFNALENNVYMFAGDVGAYATGDEFMYHSYDNLTLIASGMGGGIRDNFVIADVYADKSVSFRLISLNTSNISALGKLEDYVLE